MATCFGSSCVIIRLSKIVKERGSCTVTFVSCYDVDRYFMLTVILLQSFSIGIQIQLILCETIQTLL